MLQLERVSKFYSANGVVSAGFSKVSLNFDLGEFVAITGESGSGKSTLLNVISGLDSYEEGEMYIFDKPTSGFSGDEMEEYRKKYIANIFQTFNLVNSYTVYQNVELVLLLNGITKKDAKPKVEEIIEKVGLKEYSKTKASKLSGGQKQRVAIARALALDTPIIVADEPTGNLDSESAKSIIRLLHELSKDKLIIIVTHNYDQVEDYVTRKITMYDGKVVEDKNLKPKNITLLDEDSNVDTEIAKDKVEKNASEGKLSAGNTIRLGGRNSVNIFTKFVLLLFVFIFLCMGTFSAYTGYKQMKTLNYSMGYSEYFNGTSPDRLVITKKDKSAFTEEDLKTLAALPNVKKVVENDVMLDTTIDLSTEEAYFSTQMTDISSLKNKLAGGRMPEAPFEGVLVTEKGSYMDTLISDSLLNSEINVERSGMYGKKIKIVGYAYLTKEQASELSSNTFYYDGYLAVNKDTENEILRSYVAEHCNHEYIFANSIIPKDSAKGYYPVYASDWVPEDYVYIPQELAEYYPYSAAKWKDFTIRTSNIYFDDTEDFTVAAVYNSDNVEKLLGIPKDSMEAAVYINPKDMPRLYDKGTFQTSIIMSKLMKADDTIKACEDAGYNCLYINKAVNSQYQMMIMITNGIRVAVMAALLIFMFFISYFVIKLIFKSRNVYFSTIRMLGASKKDCSRILTIDLFVVFNIAFVLCYGFINLAKMGNIKVPNFIDDMILYIEPSNYILLYAVLCVIALLLARRYAVQMFKKTAMNAYKEEV